MPFFAGEQNKFDREFSSLTGVSLFFSSRQGSGKRYHEKLRFAARDDAFSHSGWDEISRKEGAEVVYGI